MPRVLRRVSVIVASVALVGIAVALPLALATEGGDTAGNAAETQYGEGEGCTPGYWKNNEAGWADTENFEGSPYSPSDDFDTVFGTNYFEPDITLIEALNLGGGGINALARHAVAALLNSSNSNVEYALTPQEVIELVDGAEEDPETAKDELAAYNESNCPINAFGELTS